MFATPHTGTLRYVVWEKLEEFLRAGWMPVADLGPTHGQWSVLAWHCGEECTQQPSPVRGSSDLAGVRRGGGAGHLSGEVA